MSFAASLDKLSDFGSLHALGPFRVLNLDY